MTDSPLPHLDSRNPLLRPDQRFWVCPNEGGIDYGVYVVIHVNDCESGMALLCLCR